MNIKTKTMACKYVYDFTENLQSPFCHKTYMESRKNKENNLREKARAFVNICLLLVRLFFQKSNIHCASVSSVYLVWERAANLAYHL